MTGCGTVAITICAYSDPVTSVKCTGNCGPENVTILSLYFICSFLLIVVNVFPHMSCISNVLRWRFGASLNNFTAHSALNLKILTSFFLYLKIDRFFVNVSLRVVNAGSMRGVFHHSSTETGERYEDHIIDLLAAYRHIDLHHRSCDYIFKCLDYWT